MTRGEVWTAAGGRDYASKPRPVVILQDARFDSTDSVTICPFTSDPPEAPLVRPQVEPDSGNGLQVTSRIMVDKITTVLRTKLGRKIGHLADQDMVALNRAIVVFLGLAGPVREK